MTTTIAQKSIIHSRLSSMRRLAQKCEASIRLIEEQFPDVTDRRRSLRCGWYSVTALIDKSSAQLGHIDPKNLDRISSMHYRLVLQHVYQKIEEGSRIFENSPENEFALVRWEKIWKNFLD